MDSETSAAIAALGETMNVGFARMARMEARMDAGFARMDARMDAGFARADHFFELQHAQHLELRGEFAQLRAEVRELRDRVDALTDRVDGLTDRVDGLTDRVDGLTDRVGRLEHEVSQLRDFVTREVAEIRLDLRELRGRPGQTAELRREIAELTVRVDRLEQRQSD